MGARLLLFLFFLPGLVVAQSREPIQITAQELTVQHAKGVASFTGNVKVVRSDFTLTANRLEAQYGNAGIDDLTARGQVVITRMGAVPETATGEVATFNPTANTLTLTGAVVELKRGPSTLKGDRLVYNLNSQQARVTNQGGPVQATFTPQ
jgi:lipopolysaccharide export system protein LptA